MDRKVEAGTARAAGVVPVFSVANEALKCYEKALSCRKTRSGYSHAPAPKGDT